MIQEILTYLTITLAILIAANNIIKVFWKKKPSHTVKLNTNKGCDSCTSECNLKEQQIIIPEKFIPIKK